MTTKKKTPKSEKSLTIIKPPEQNPLMIQAETLIKSRMLPAVLQRPEQVLAIMMRGKELGIGPMEALTSINVVNGKVTSSTQLMLALIYRSGFIEDIEMIRADPATCMMKRKGMTPHKVTFGSKDAKAMGLLNKDTYRKFPETMFLWRAIAMCARVVFPDIIGAVYTPDELGIEIQSDNPDASVENGNSFQASEPEREFSILPASVEVDERDNGNLSPLEKMRARQREKRGEA